MFAPRGSMIDDKPTRLAALSFEVGFPIMCPVDDFKHQSPTSMDIDFGILS